MKHVLFTLFFLLTPVMLLADEEVTQIYKKIEIDGEAIAVNRRGSTLEDVDYILVEINSRDIDTKKYEVTVSREDTHLYKIDGTDLIIKMPYCYKYAMREKAILDVKNKYFKPQGRLIWLDD